MTKKIRKAAKSKNAAADTISMPMSGDAKMETMKSSESGQAPTKPKTNGSKSARFKAGTLSVTDLRADSIVMTRKKADKPLEAAAKPAAAGISKPVRTRAKSAVKAGAKPKAAKQTESKSETVVKQGPKKQYIKAGKACKVTFRLPKAAAPNAQVVTVVGDFNNWNVSETKMKKLKNGDFTTTLELPCNREYRFRYFIDASRWENDWSADKYVRNRYGSDDSVVVIEGKGSA